MGEDRDAIDDSTPEEPKPPLQDKLTAAERSEVTDHINRKAAHPQDACPVCASPRNFVLEDIYRTDVVAANPVTTTAYQPLTATLCLNCGFVRFFNLNLVRKLIEEEREKAGGDDGG